MDTAKLVVLRTEGYTIPKVCGLCKHSTFPQNDWGTCGVISYEHLKHSGLPRQLSIHKSGSCANRFELDQGEADKLGHFREFLR